MTAPTDWLALCAIAASSDAADCDMESVISQMRTALAQPEPGPEPQGVSYRQLLAALESLIHKFDTEDCTTICELEPWKDLVSAAKDTQPEPQGPTDEEIEQEAVANADTDDEYRAFKRGAFFVQERIHRPVIQPVPEGISQ
jgi:hypothetical protein